MKNYLVKIRVELPYPIDKEYREEASRMAVAVKRVMDKHRKELNSKKVKKVAIKVIQL